MNKILLAIAIGLCLSSCKDISETEYPTTTSVQTGGTCTDRAPLANVSQICKIRTTDPSVSCFVNTATGDISCVRNE